MHKINDQREELLAKMLSIIKKNPGIRPSELNRLLDCPHSWSLRKTLIKRGLVIKKKEGVAVCYYPNGKTSTASKCIKPRRRREG